MSGRAPWTLLVSTLATLALFVTACGEAVEDTEPEPVPEEEAAYNEADVGFLQAMIPHHEQAVDMAELVPDRTDRTELLQLAEDIIETQQAEITEMRALLDDAGATDVHADHGVEHDMPGMMTPEQMAELEGLDGDAFDLRFLDMMIAHHQGAVDMSEEVIATGQHPAVRILAEEIMIEQQAEIDQMVAWRDEWAAGS